MVFFFLILLYLVVCLKILNVNSDGLGMHCCCRFDATAVCHEGESKIQVGWINHSITTQHITLSKQPNLNTTLLHCGINVSWMHYIGFFQQSSLPLWPGHDHLSTFFTFRNLLSTFVTPAMARWYPESWTTSKAWKKLILGNANNSELIFLARFATSIGCISFVVAILCSRSCPYWTIRIKKMHLCSSQDHHSRRIDRICALNHVTMHVRRYASMCCHPTWSSTPIQVAQPLPVLHVASSPLLVVVATISSPQKPQDNKQCAGRHRTGTQTLQLTWLTKLERLYLSGTKSR